MCMDAQRMSSGVSSCMCVLTTDVPDLCEKILYLPSTSTPSLFDLQNEKYQKSRVDFLHVKLI